MPFLRKVLVYRGWLKGRYRVEVPAGDPSGLKISGLEKNRILMEPDGRETQMADADRSTQVSLGCGTLILIALIVLMFSGRSGDEVKREIQSLDSTVRQLKTAIDSQSDQIKALRQTMEDMRTKTSPLEGAEKR
jgi:hypothetical protein